MDGEEKRQKTETYDDEAAHGDQVPEHVLFPRKSGIAHFNLAQVLIRPHRVQYEAEFWTREEKRRHEPPYFRWEPEQPALVEVDISELNECGVINSQRGKDDGCREVPEGTRVNTKQWRWSAMGTGGCSPRKRGRGPIGVQYLRHFVLMVWNRLRCLRGLPRIFMGSSQVQSSFLREACC